MNRTERLINTFSELVAIDSPSFGERSAADYIRARLQKLGISCTEDDAGKKIGGSCGNLFARVPGDVRKAPLLFCTHMDTVEPSRGKRAVLHPDGTITSAGDTVLGADDFAGVAAVLEALERLAEENAEHPPLELLFTVAEEPYCTGVRYFDFAQCTAKTGFVLDLTGPVGTAAVAAPTILSFSLTVTGRAAHAGFAPEAGVNAVEAAAKSLAQLPQGRLEGGTTLNFGMISGGEAANIVPARCTVTGEIRSVLHERALAAFDRVCTVFQREAAASGAQVTISHDIPLRAYRAAENGDAVRRFRRACGKLGLPVRLVETFGGSDNAALQAHGIDGIVAANAMFNCHAADEYTTVSELEKATALVYALITDEMEERGRAE
ncbi:MAG: M20/M25/M40 family metallo-hydrolase [Hominenteromicrobium sp.]